MDKKQEITIAYLCNKTGNTDCKKTNCDTCNHTLDISKAINAKEGAILQFKVISAEKERVILEEIAYKNILENYGELKRFNENAITAYQVLSKENEKLKERYKKRAKISSELCEALKMYEKAIDILDGKFKFELGVSIVKEKYYYSLEFLFNNSYLTITKEEYELLKEVLDND